MGIARLHRWSYKRNGPSSCAAIMCRVVKQMETSFYDCNCRNIGLRVTADTFHRYSHDQSKTQILRIRNSPHKSKKGCVSELDNESYGTGIYIMPLLMGKRNRVTHYRSPHIIMRSFSCYNLESIFLVENVRNNTCIKGGEDFTRIDVCNFVHIRY